MNFEIKFHSIHSELINCDKACMLIVVSNNAYLVINPSGKIE